MAMNQSQKDEMATLTAMNQSLTVRVQEMSEDRKKIEELQTVNMALKMKNESLMMEKERMQRVDNEQKEKDVIIQELRAKVRKLEAVSLNTAQYESWNYEKVFMWMMSLE